VIREVGCRPELRVSAQARLAPQIAVVGERTAAFAVAELDVALDGRPLQPREPAGAHAGRVHAVVCSAGRLVVEYAATVSGQAEPVAADELELLTYLQPSRYCESDRLAALAGSEFSGLTGKALLDGVSSWVGMRLFYVPGSSISTDGAVETLLAGRGVCRDYARRRRGPCRRRLAGRRSDAARAARPDGPDRHRPRRRRDRVPE
jgi:hypothetical protein